MRYALLAAIGLCLSSAISATRAEDNAASITLYTSATGATEFHCNVVNVGRKTLQIAISVIGDDGTLLFVAPASVAPATVASGDFSTTPNVTDGYCKFDVLGTGNGNQVRAILNANVLRMIPGTMTPTFLTKILEAR